MKSDHDQFVITGPVSVLQSRGGARARGVGMGGPFGVEEMLKYMRSSPWEF